MIGSLTRNSPNAFALHGNNHAVPISLAIWVQHNSLQYFFFGPRNCPRCNRPSCMFAIDLDVAQCIEDHLQVFPWPKLWVRTAHRIFSGYGIYYSTFKYAFHIVISHQYLCLLCLALLHHNELQDFLPHLKSIEMSCAYSKQLKLFGGPPAAPRETPRETASVQVTNPPKDDSLAERSFALA